MRKLIVLILLAFTQVLYGQNKMVFLDSIVVKGNQSWWNGNTRLNPLRLPPPQEGVKIYYYDLTGDGKPDVLRTETIGGVPVQWIDDNGDMKIGDVSGDIVDDCVMIDCNKDGQYASFKDVVVDWVDTDSDGKADFQTYINYRPGGIPKPKEGHYMIVFDLDKDNVFNYIDWNTFDIRCWFHYGISDFYEDYHGNSTFLKVLASAERLNDVRLNWEVPFLFMDHDKDGLTEMTIRLIDICGVSATNGFTGTINYAALSVDMDNDNTPENPLDMDMSVIYRSDEPTSYMKYSHIYKKMRGLPESDILFMDPNWRQNSELIFPLGEQCFDFIFKDAKWDRAWFVYDEDGDCKRWERVEQYEPRDLYTLGVNNGGLDNHLQSDAIGDRGEWDEDNSGDGSLYISPMDGKIHLYGAEWGAWRIDQNAESWQGMGAVWYPVQDTFEKFAVIKYEDTDNNGFVDLMRCDWNGDRTFDEIFSLRELGLSDTADIIKIPDLRGKDYTKIYTKMANNMWKHAESAMKVAEKLGLDSRWYSIYQHPKSLRQKYEFGYWIQLYVYHDIADLAKRNGDKQLETEATKAWLSGTWNRLK